MVELNEEKYRSVILYLCSKLDNRSIRGKKKLAKLLYFVDFDRFEFKESMVSVTGDTYVRLEMGPVPNTYQSVVDRMVEDGEISVSKQIEFNGQTRPTVVYQALKEPDLSLFSEDELFILERVARKYVELNGKDLENLSHREAPWVGVEPLDEIPFELAFYRGTDFTDETRVA